MTKNKPELKTTALLNAKVITVDSNDSIAEAVLIMDDKILAVGSNDEIKALLPDNGRSIDLGGRSVIPGIVDSHVHIELTVDHLVNALNVHQPEFSSIEAILNRISEKAKDTPAGEWIYVKASCNFEKNILEKRFPTLEELDKAAPDNPLVFDSEFHILTLNTCAIKNLGWTHETWLPKNATMGRDPETGKQNGFFGEVWQDIPPHPWGYDKLKAALCEGTIKHYVSRGVTSAHELPQSIEGIRCWQQLKKEGDLPLRLRFYMEHPHLIDIDTLSSLGFEKGFGDEWLSLGGLKLFIDGIGWHANQYPIEDFNFTQKELNDIVYKAHKSGLQIWSHTITKNAVRMGLKAYKKAIEMHPVKDHRHRLEHSGDDIQSFADPYKVIKEFKNSGIVPIVTPQFIYYYNDPGAPIRRLIDEGFILPGNSDTTGNEPEACNPWFGIWNAVTRKNFAGEVLTPDQCITSYEAIKMFTLWGAWGGFEENIKGSIEPGKLADMVVLGEDPLTVDHDALRDMPVELVIVGGKEKHSSTAFKGALE